MGAQRQRQGKVCHPFPADRADVHGQHFTASPSGGSEFSIMTQAPAEEIRFYSRPDAGAYLQRKSRRMIGSPALLESLLLESVRDVLFQPVEATESKSVPII